MTTIQSRLPILHIRVQIPDQLGPSGHDASYCGKWFAETSRAFLDSAPMAGIVCALCVSEVERE